MPASLDLALDAGASVGTDERGVSRPGGYQHPVARLQRQRPTIAEDEIDRSGRAVEQLVVRVSVLLVTVSRSIRPPVHVVGFGAQPLLDRAGVGRRPAVPVDEHVHTATIRGGAPTSELTRYPILMTALPTLIAAALRVAQVAVFVLALLPLGANTAWACLCDRLVPREAAANAAAVFTGVARGRISPERLGFGERVEFNVETVYKGGVPNRWAVTVDATSCGDVFSDGERYTVFATVEARTNLCMGNVQGTIDPATYGVVPIAVYPNSQLIDLGRTADRLTLAAMLLVGLSALAWARLRRARSA